MFRNITQISDDQKFDDEFSDYVVIAPPPKFDDDDDFINDDSEDGISDNVDVSQEALDNLSSLINESSRVDQLLTLCDVAQETGSTEALFQYALRTELLSSVSPDAFSLESFQDQTALEGLVASAMGKIKSLSTRAISAVKSVVGSIVGKIGSAVNRLKAFIGRIGTKINATAKAHPYVTAVAAVTAMAAVTAVTLVIVGQRSSEGDTDSIKEGYAKARKMAEDIKNPFGRVEETPSGGSRWNGKTVDAEPASTSSPWTIERLKDIANKALQNASKGLSVLKQVGMTVLKTIGSYAKAGYMKYKKFDENAAVKPSVFAGLAARHGIDKAAGRRTKFGFYAGLFVAGAVARLIRTIYIKIFVSAIVMVIDLIKMLCRGVKTLVTGGNPVADPVTA